MTTPRRSRRLRVALEVYCGLIILPGGEAALLEIVRGGNDGQHRETITVRPIIAPKHQYPAVREDLHPLLALVPGNCRWPIGDPQTTSFHFCADAAEPGKPYCRHHVEMARQQPRY